MIQYYSFDIFDTCFVRSCGHPETVFDILSQEILGPDANPVWYMDFAHERKSGESRARQALKKTLSEEVTIHDIYDHCDFTHYTTIPNDEILRTEIALEKKVLSPVKCILDQIRSLHRNGKKVIFISDMYLPYEFVLQLLCENEMFHDGDHLYLSCDIGKTKQTGSLFNYVIEDLKIAPSHLFHYGDNQYSDIIIPKKIGIHTRRVLHKYTNYEAILFNRDYSGLKKDVTILSSISKAVRLSVDDSAVNKFAADFVAPIFVPFVYSILQDARKRQISNLYFFARDAYILYKIAQQFIAEFPTIELHYLYVSRNSLYMPTLDTISFESISNLFWNFKDITANEILDRLHMNNIDSCKYCQSSSDSTSALTAMLNDNLFISKLKQNIQEQRILLLKYLKQEGLGDRNCAIVDLTGTRKCHLAINKLLSNAGLNPTYAYYFSVNENRIPGTNYFASFFEERYDRDNLNLSLRPHDLFEQYFCITSQNRTSSYEMNGNIVSPVFEKDHSTGQYNNKISEANITICQAFAKHFSFVLKDADIQYLLQSATSVYSFFYHVPRKEYLKTFIGLTFSESSQTTTPMLNNRCLVKTLFDRKPIWRIAELMLNFPFPGLLYHILKKRYFESCCNGNKTKGSRNLYIV